MYINTCNSIYLRGLNITIYDKNTKNNDPTFLQTVHIISYYNRYY